jgi:hypothetical protein
VYVCLIFALDEFNSNFAAILRFCSGFCLQFWSCTQFCGQFSAQGDDKSLSAIDNDKHNTREEIAKLAPSEKIFHFPPN